LDLGLERMRKREREEKGEDLGFFSLLFFILYERERERERDGGFLKSKIFFIRRILLTTGEGLIF